MLGIGVLGASSAAYYLDTVASGREDYYLGSGEAPGVWFGHHAATFGLDGAVDGEDLHAVLEGFDPDSGARLDRGRANRANGSWRAITSRPRSHRVPTDHKRGPASSSREVLGGLRHIGEHASSCASCDAAWYEEHRIPYRQRGYPFQHVPRDQLALSRDRLDRVPTQAPAKLRLVAQMLLFDPPIIPIAARRSLVCAQLLAQERTRGGLRLRARTE